MRAREDLIAGVCAGDTQLVRSALLQGASSNSRFRGWSVLFWAVQEGHLEIAEMLIRAGASPQSQDRTGCTPLDQAAGAGKFKMVELLLRLGAKVNQRTRHGTPLHMACAYRRLRIVKLLLANGANPSIRDREGQLPIDLTEQRSNRIDKAIQKLLRRVSDS